MLVKYTALSQSGLCVPVCVSLYVKQYGIAVLGLLLCKWVIPQGQSLHDGLCDIMKPYE